MVRKYTNALCVAIDQGTLSAESVVNMCLQHMSENDVADFGPDNEEDYFEDNMTDAEADADVLASAGWGTDEDYGCFSGDDY